MNEEIREAAEQLLQQQSLPPACTPHSYSINTIPSLHSDYIISQDLLEGQRTNGRLSNVRRCFCLFVTFDLLFTGLMWLICIMLKGENIMKALNEQINHYDIHTSLFDVVLAAICRFVVLLLFYACIYMNHWIIVAVSTTITCAFLIAKVFVYDWLDSKQPFFEVLLILISFVLCWGEAWFLDFRVLPQESLPRRFFIPNSNSERAPLIQRYIDASSSYYTESVGNFYSPLASPDGSMLRFNTEPSLGVYPSVHFTHEQTEQYKILAAKTLQEAWDLLCNENWKLEKAMGADTIHTMMLTDIGNIFKLTTVIDVRSKYLLEELFCRVEALPKWSPSVLESHKVQVIDEHTDITYQIGASAAKGLVTSRDFVNLRHWDFVEGSYIMAVVSTEHPSLPKNDKYIRGENRISCWSMQEDPSNPNKTTMHWILNTNLNGIISKYILDKAIVGMMLDYAKHLKAHISIQQDAGRL